MNKTQLIKKLARLESKNDQLLTEVHYLDHLLRSVGFPGGLTAAKAVAEELLTEENQEEGGH